MKKKIFISTGEVSGDLHGSLLAKELFEESRKQSIVTYGVSYCYLGCQLLLPRVSAIVT